MAMMRSALGGILRRSGAARLPAGGCRFSTGQGADKLADQTTTFLGKLKALPMYLLKEHWLPLSAREKLISLAGLYALALLVDKERTASASLAKETAMFNARRSAATAAADQRPKDGNRVLLA